LLHELQWSPASIKNKKTDQPNIVLIMADDLDFSDLGCYGNEIPPNIDYFDEQGVRFTQFTNAAKCFPSRTNLLTGLLPRNAAWPSGLIHSA
jgi:arylsulfatase